MTVTLKRRWLAVAVAALLAVLAASLAACGPNNGNSTELNDQRSQTNTYETNQRIPHFNYSQERQNLIDIETMQTQAVQTTTFFMELGVRDPIGSCPSIGFGIPDSASLTNPLQGAPNDGQIAVGQMDPNGIYAPTSSQGTFVICLTATGSPYIDRIESEANTYGGPAQWDYTKHQAVLVGAPTAPAKLVPASKTKRK